MNPLQEMVFFGEIVLQSKIVFKAHERLLLAVDKGDRVELWSSIQSILVASGNISKILWPSRNKSKDRGLYLRKMLKIEEDHILSNRKFRDHFEHYDERIEKWFLDKPGASYVDLSMNPSLRSSLPQNDHRGYNSIDNTLVFRGETLDFKKILDGVQQIYQNCKPYTLL
jgi:hypothetical protein